MIKTLLTSLLLAGLGLGLAGSCSKPPGQADFDRGVYELKRGNHVRAKALLEKSVSRRPGSDQNALAYNYIGLAAYRLGQYQAAQEAFEDSRRLSPTLAEPVYNLGVLLAASGDLARSVRLLEEAARMDERDPRALEYLGRLYSERRQWPEARRMLYAALDRAPESPRVLTALASVDLHTTGPQKAVELLTSALKKDHRYAPALFNLAVIYDRWLQDRSHARSYYKRFLGANDDGAWADHARAALERLEGKSDARPAPAPEAAAAPAPVPAPPAIAAPVVAAPPAAPTASAPPEDPLAQAETRAARGDEKGALDLCLQVAARAAREGRADLQEKALRTATRLCFDEARAHHELGLFLLARGKADQALKSFKQAVTLDRSLAAAHLGMARAAVQTGEFDAALVGLNQAVKADPKDADALWELAQLLDRPLQLNEKAALTYRDFEKKFPSDPRTLQAAERARALSPPLRAVTAPLARAPETPAASPRPVAAPSRQVSAVVTPPAGARPAPPRPARQLQFKRPATRNTAAAVLAFNQGAQYQQQRNWGQAIASYLRALENDDQLTSAYYNLGLAYSAQGDRDLAKDAYLRALEVQPDLVGARYNLALLYYQGGDLASAMTLLQEVVRAKPDYAAAHYTMGLIYTEKPETLAQAREAYSRFLHLAPNDPSAAVVRQWLASH